MQSSCYILRSEKIKRYYVGVSQGDLQERIKKHNEKAYGGRSYTSVADDWELYVLIECESFSQARKIENHIKRMKSKVYIENLVKYQEMIEKLKSQYAG